MNLEPKISFDYTLTTEERFSFRRFLENFIDQFNSLEPREIENMFDVKFEAFGIARDEKFNLHQFFEFVSTNRQNKILEWYRFPELKVRKKDGFFFVNGSMEVLNDKMLMMEGEIDMEALYFPIEEEYKFLFFTFSPRLVVSF